MSQTMIKHEIPRKEFLSPGHLACPGCGGSIAMRTVLKGLGEDTMVVLPACCWSIIAGPWPQSSLKVPLYHTAFETGGAVASGIKAALEVRGNHETTVMAWAGDGGTFDIGLQALSGAAERNEDIIYCCYDNEAYMNTGVQRSSSTPAGAWTTTTPSDHPESHPKKDILSIIAAHRVPYAATASVAYPQDLLQKVRRAKSIRGTKFIHILSPCPPGWKHPDESTVDLARQAVQSRLFPLVEVENGQTWRFTMDHEGYPIAPYIKAQGRFRQLSNQQIEDIQQQINERWTVWENRVKYGT